MENWDGIKAILRRSPVLWRSLWYIKFKFGLSRDWDERIRHVLDCEDNRFIPRVAEAGKEVGGCQVMHNGIRVKSGSYYGYPNVRLLKLNRGVHEPQEERAFGEVLKYIPAGSAMLELGSYWAFYSMWFHRDIEDALNICVEPEAENLTMGKENFQLNGMSASFEHAFIGDVVSSEEGAVPRTTVDDICTRHNLGHLAVLHSDIQGHEVQMLRGARRMFKSRSIDYCFISTHGNEIHDECRRTLQQYSHDILADANCDESFSVDGLLVSRRSELKGAGPLAISKR